MSLLQVINDASAYDDENLWGIPSDACGVARNPPETWYPKQVKAETTARRTGGLVLSHNEKTRITLSEWFGRHNVRSNPFGTCQGATEWCEENCYGHCERISGPAPQSAYEQNVAILRKLYAEKSHRKLYKLAEDVVETCVHYGLMNLRWHGVGDLNKASNALLLAVTEIAPEFLCWGFTRMPELLLQLPVRENLIFWLSVDRTTPAPRIELARKAASLHGTGFAFASEVGEAVSNQVHRTPLRAQPDDALIRQDRRFYTSLEGEIAVAFGYHGAARLTHLDLIEECPATDPYGGGHFYGACQFCEWCMLREKPARTLKEWRQVRTWTEHGHAYSLDSFA